MSNELAHKTHTYMRIICLNKENKIKIYSAIFLYTKIFIYIKLYKYRNI